MNQNQICGSGTFEKENCFRYTGNFTNGVFEGSGSFQFGENEYIGSFKNGLPEGNAELKV